MNSASGIRLSSERIFFVGGSSSIGTISTGGAGEICGGPLPVCIPM